jgi:hypothetical protein
MSMKGSNIVIECNTVKMITGSTSDTELGAVLNSIMFFHELYF